MIELILRFFGVRDLTTAEAHRELDLVAGFQEATSGASLEGEIVLVGFWPELDLFDIDAGLLALGFTRFFLLFVFVLSEIEKFANRRFGLRIDFDEIEPEILSGSQGVRCRHDAEHSAVSADDADFGNADAMVDADLWATLLRARIESGSPHHILSLRPPLRVRVGKEAS